MHQPTRSSQPSRNWWVQMRNDNFEIRRYNELKMVSAELYDQIKKGYGRHIDNLTWFLEFMDEMFPDLTGGDYE